LADLVFVLIVVAFFALAAGYVALCDRIIGPDPDPDSSASDDDTTTSGHRPLEAEATVAS
jgi:hypothetical protein